jgi:hypothetical protein
MSGLTGDAETSAVEQQGGRDLGTWITAKHAGIARSLARWSGRPFEECLKVMADAPPASGPDARAHEPLRRFVEEHQTTTAIRRHYDRWIMFRRKMHVADLALDPLINE